jgi:hypothetical protein
MEVDVNAITVRGITRPRTGFGSWIDIFIEGYGQCNMPAGTGAPIYLEVQDDGTPKLYVWADINQEDPTHIIDLSGAKEVTHGQ